MGFVLFSELDFDGGEVYSVFEGLLLGFHGLDLAADGGDLLFDFEDIGESAGALGEDAAEAVFGLAGVVEACCEVGVLFGDLFAGLSFVLDAALFDNSVICC